jgi:hypothetical protein
MESDSTDRAPAHASILDHLQHAGNKVPDGRNRRGTPCTFLPMIDSSDAVPQTDKEEEGNSQPQIFCDSRLSEVMEEGACEDESASVVAWSTLPPPCWKLQGDARRYTQHLLEYLMHFCTRWRLTWLPIRALDRRRSWHLLGVIVLDPGAHVPFGGCPPHKQSHCKHQDSGQEHHRGAAADPKRSPPPRP